MKSFKKLLIAAAFAIAACPSAFASPITVGGVTWDPDYSATTESDFTSEFRFTQWYSTTISNRGEINNFNNAVRIGDVASSIDGSEIDSGFFLQGVGDVFALNGRTLTDPPSFLDGSSEMTYAFGGIKLKRNGTFDTTDGWASIYVNSTDPNYRHPPDTDAEVQDALSGSLWLDLEIDQMTFISGDLVNNGLVSALLNVVGGDAAFNFRPSTLIYSGDATFANLDAAYTSRGNGSVSGNTIPEPGTIALLALGLIGGVAVSRRKKA